MDKPSPIPTKQITLPDWALVCDQIGQFGNLELDCTMEETRALYIWAKKYRGKKLKCRTTNLGVMVSLSETK